MQVYAARQAVLNRRKQTVAYELLFRDSDKNVFPNIDSTVATSKLMLNQHFNVGFKSLTQGKKALINFSEQGIIDQVPALLPVQDIVVEILEDVNPSDQVFLACRELFKKGYRFALDDFQYHNGWDRFMPFTRLIKFDIMATPLKEIGPILEKLKQHKKIKFLAEKVETQEEYVLARKMGFDYFQGYFFCKPEMIANKDIDTNYGVVMAIYTEVLKDNFSYDKLTSYFEKDVSLTYKLLQFINSGMFQLREPIGSIKQALIYLGDERAKKFIALIATAHLGSKKPIELVKMSIVRGRFCEHIAKASEKVSTENAFLAGLFSLVDAILDKEMEDVLETMPLAEDIKGALLGFRNEIYHTLELAKAFESGSWYNTQKKANVVGIPQDKLPLMYQSAVRWSENCEQSTRSAVA